MILLACIRKSSFVSPTLSFCTDCVSNSVAWPGSYAGSASCLAGSTMSGVAGGFVTGSGGGTEILVI